MIGKIYEKLKTWVIVSPKVIITPGTPIPEDDTEENSENYTVKNEKNESSKFCGGPSHTHFDKDSIYNFDTDSDVEGLSYYDSMCSKIIVC